MKVFVSSGTVDIIASGSNARIAHGIVIVRTMAGASALARSMQKS
jgi:hypothetical protein